MTEVRTTALPAPSSDSGGGVEGSGGATDGGGIAAPRTSSAGLIAGGLPRTPSDVAVHYPSPPTFPSGGGVNLLSEVRRQLRTKRDGLSKLVQCLEAHRSLGVVIPCRDHLDVLGSLLLVALDVVDQRSEFGFATSLMVLSQTYYLEVEVDPLQAMTATKGRWRSASTIVQDIDSDESSSRVVGRLYLHSKVHRHRVWQNMRFWESAVLESISNEMSRASSSGVLEQEARDREVEVSMGQLGFFAYNMVKFEVPAESIRALLLKYSRLAKSSAVEWDAMQAQVEMFIADRDGAVGGTIAGHSTASSASAGRQSIGGT